jgi:hypothetical protein
MSNHRSFPPHFLFNPLSSFACIPLVNPDCLHARTNPCDGFQQERYAFSILHIGLVNSDAENEPWRIDKTMPFAAIHLLASIKAPRSASLCGFHGLAVADPSWGWLLALLAYDTARVRRS